MSGVELSGVEMSGVELSGVEMSNPHRWRSNIQEGIQDSGLRRKVPVWNWRYLPTGQRLHLLDINVPLNQKKQDLELREYE